MRYRIVEWPYSNEYMDKPGFDEHACLINDEDWIKKYGTEAYFIDEDWIENINNANTENLQ